MHQARDLHMKKYIRREAVHNIECRLISRLLTFAIKQILKLVDGDSAAYGSRHPHALPHKRGQTSFHDARCGTSAVIGNDQHRRAGLLREGRCSRPIPLAQEPLCDRPGVNPSVRVQLEKRAQCNFELT